MKYFYAFLLLLFATNCISQNSLLFKKITNKDSIKLICLTDQFDTLQTNKRFTFFCDNKVSANEVLSSFKVGQITKEQSDEYGLNLYILKGKEVLSTQIVINPSFQNVNTDVLGQFNYYAFDTNQLKKINSKYPVDYFSKWLTFDSKLKFDEFINTHSKDSALLCYEDNTLEFTGIGIIKINKDKVIKDGFVGVTYIEKILNKIPNNNKEFLVGFTPYNSSQETFSFTVQCNKELFDKIVDERCKKISWELNKFELLTYWRK